MLKEICLTARQTHSLDRPPGTPPRCVAVAEPEKSPPTTGLTDIYDRIGEFLKLPTGELSRLVDGQRKEQLEKHVRSCKACVQSARAWCCANARRANPGGSSGVSGYGCVQRVGGKLRIVSRPDYRRVGHRREDVRDGSGAEPAAGAGEPEAIRVLGRAERAGGHGHGAGAGRVSVGQIAER